MKLMNEIAAPCSGRIDKILLADGQVAEFGETLFLINPDN
jgi:biotin carboxyl carrier protein